MIKAIKYYQKLAVNKQTRCRYHPSCSFYGLECYQKFGFLKATSLTIWRILRCNPLSKGGYDPVPLNYLEKLFKEDY